MTAASTAVRRWACCLCTSGSNQVQLSRQEWMEWRVRTSRRWLWSSGQALLQGCICNRQSQLCLSHSQPKAPRPYQAAPACMRTSPPSALCWTSQLLAVEAARCSGSAWRCSRSGGRAIACGWLVMVPAVLQRSWHCCSSWHRHAQSLRLTTSQLGLSSNSSIPSRRWKEQQLQFLLQLLLQLPTSAASVRLGLAAPPCLLCRHKQQLKVRPGGTWERSPMR